MTTHSITKFLIIFNYFLLICISAKRVNIQFTQLLESSVKYVQFYDRLSNDFTQLLESGVNYDVSIEVGEGDVNIYKVHSIILQSRSPYFKKRLNEITFNDDHVKGIKLPNDNHIKVIKLPDDHVKVLKLPNDHVKVLKLPNISFKVFDVIIKYTYGGKVSLETLENSVIFDLLIASNELELDELVEHLQYHLVNDNSLWLKSNVAQVYRTSYQVKNFKIIKDFCNDVISEYSDKIFESENFHSLPEDALISILKRDDLQLEEGKIWEYTIQWGKAKNPNLPTSLDKWTSDDFLTLKETLNQCLQHIRYFSISGEDVIKKIFPYQQLLEHQLFLDINTKLITSNLPISSLVLPPRKLITYIITDEHALEISSWIDKKETSYIENNPYEFKLLVRGSRDGFDVKTIYNICDKISNTVIILKVEGTEEILGGYNPIEWEKNNDRSVKTEESFIFSLKTANLKNSILSRTLNSNYSAIYNYPRNSRLSFSCALCLIGNLKIENRCYCMANLVYSKPIRSDEFISSLSSVPSEKSLFSVEEYEIFKISPKIKE
ncbi:hypothetical protein Glove_164g2 [Diversispora epigaea]|uniref:BTB domain-containing protein n=1 Tax=Diversispora epigaea TaxID=1348612 RepID=A0A397ITZ4_9GLOM|nr:hypothetical protein Glove_164g2 [Diversispora epigaea]